LVVVGGHSRGDPRRLLVRAAAAAIARGNCNLE
jgi:hypothetical protein